MPNNNDRIKFFEKKRWESFSSALDLVLRKKGNNIIREKLKYIPGLTYYQIMQYTYIPSIRNILNETKRLTRQKDFFYKTKE